MAYVVFGLHVLLQVSTMITDSLPTPWYNFYTLHVLLRHMYSYMQLVSGFPLSSRWMLQIWNTADQTYALCLISHISHVSFLTPSQTFWVFGASLYFSIQRSEWTQATPHTSRCNVQINPCIIYTIEKVLSINCCSYQGLEITTYHHPTIKHLLCGHPNITQVMYIITQ
jgi:hypothetical protein